MLNQEFLDSIERDFPDLFATASGEVSRDLDFLLRASRSDEHVAKVLARPYAGALLWYPYLRATLPVGRSERRAQEAVVRIVLLVDKLHGYEPTVEEARSQIDRVLHLAVDPWEFLAKLPEQLPNPTEEGAPLAWAAPVVAFIAPRFSPAALFGMARALPLEFLLTGSAFVAAALATIPLVTGWSIANLASNTAGPSTPKTIYHVIPPSRPSAEARSHDESPALEAGRAKGNPERSDF
ncbi:MAG: hypothetical protein ACYDDF_15305 [Thermoplasmatota archaeon]